MLVLNVEKVTWRGYLHSQLYMTGYFDHASQKLKPIPQTFQHVTAIDTYDRLRWMRQVETTYDSKFSSGLHVKQHVIDTSTTNSVPSSRQKLCEAMMWGGYAFFNTENLLPSEVYHRLKNQLSMWNKLRGPSPALGTGKLQLWTFMHHITGVTEKTWTESQNLRNYTPHYITTETQRLTISFGKTWASARSLPSRRNLTGVSFSPRSPATDLIADCLMFL